MDWGRKGEGRKEAREGGRKEERREEGRKKSGENLVGSEKEW